MDLNKIIKLKDNKTAKQTALLFTAQVTSLVISFIAGLFLAKGMGPIKFGLYSFALSVLNFTALFFEFGYFTSGAKILAQNNNEKEEKEWIGLLLIFLIVISISFILATYCLSIIIDKFFQDKIGYILRAVLFISFPLIIPFFLELICKGTNKIKLFALNKIQIKIFFFFGIIGLLLFKILIPIYVLSVFLISILLPFLINLFRLKPSFNKLKSHFSILQKENKKYGLHIYWARIVAVSTYEIDKILISFFSGATQVGYYAIAASIAMPIMFFSSSLAASKFKTFSNQKRIFPRIIKANILLILISALVSLSGGFIVIHFILGATYKKSLILLFFLVLAVCFQAGYQPYNQWLTSNGYGKELRKICFIIASINIICNFLLIPFYGALGAAIASLCSMLIGYFLYRINYFKICRKRNIKEENQCENPEKNISKLS